MTTTTNAKGLSEAKKMKAEALAAQKAAEDAATKAEAALAAIRSGAVSAAEMRAEVKRGFRMMSRGAYLDQESERVEAEQAKLADARDAAEKRAIEAAEGL